jgi:hypothetical protein
MENWLVGQSLYAVTAIIEWKSVVEVQVHWKFRHEFGVGRHGRITYRTLF